MKTTTAALAIALSCVACARTNPPPAAPMTEVASTPAPSGMTSRMADDHGTTEDITSSIRRRLLRDETLSSTARNVSILTMGTRVTLSGIVRTDAERVTIETVARQTVGVTDVDYQLVVK